MADAVSDSFVSNQLDHLFAAHQRADRALAVSLYGSILLGLIVISLIALPYAERVAEQRALAGQRDALLADIAMETRALEQVTQSESRYEALEAAWGELLHVMGDWDVYESLAEAAPQQARLLESVKRDVIDCVGEDFEPLRVWLQEPGARRPDIDDHFWQNRCLASALGYRVTSDHCWWRLGLDWQYCRLAADITDRHRSAIEIFRRFEYPLEEPQPDGIEALVAQTTAFLDGRSELDGQIRPDEFHMVREHLGPLRTGYRDFVSMVEHALRSKRAQFETSLTEHEQRARALAEDLQEVSDEIDRINSFDRLQTPLGEVPITLNALVLALPAVLWGSFLHCLATLQRTMDLRAEIARLYRRQDPDGRVVSGRQLALLAPVWIEPWHSWPRKLMRFSLLATPLVLAVGSGMYFAWLGVLRHGAADFPGGIAGIVVTYAALLIGLLATVPGTVCTILHDGRKRDEQSPETSPDQKL